MTDAEKIEALRKALQDMVDHAPEESYTGEGGSYRCCAYCGEPNSHRSDCLIRTANEVLRDTADRPYLRVSR